MTIKKINIDDSTLPIREFKITSMGSNPAICIIAKRGSGKSTVVKCILSQFHNIPGGIIIAPTDKMNVFYGKFFPETYIHYEYDSDVIQNVLRRQELIKMKYNKKKEEGKVFDPRAFIIMDDCLSSNMSWKKDPAIREIFYNGRHCKLIYILTMQFPLGIGPELRGNFDYIFLLAEDFLNNQKRLYEHYAGMFPNFDSFRQVFMDLTSNYGAMVIANKGAKASFLEKIFWYRANKYEQITKIGCRQFNKFHEDNYDKLWNEKKKSFDIGTLVANKPKNSKIQISKVSFNANNEI